MRQSRAIIFNLLILFVAFSTNAADLEQWIYEKIIEDEEIVKKSVAKQDGHDIRLLRLSSRYVPLFSEIPGSEKNFKTSAPAGGYLFKIQTRTGDFYALSGGLWQNSSWYYPQTRKTIEISPSNLYVSQNQQNWEFATLMDGRPPELITYDAKGNQIRKVSFDLSNPNIEKTIAGAITELGQTKTPTVEKILLSEYLSGQQSNWRPLAKSGKFNLRNQHLAKEEIERIENQPKLTRNRVKQLLIDNYEVQAIEVDSTVE